MQFQRMGRCGNGAQCKNFWSKENATCIWQSKTQDAAFLGSLGLWQLSQTEAGSMKKKGAILQKG